MITIGDRNRPSISQRASRTSLGNIGVAKENLIPANDFVKTGSNQLVVSNEACKLRYRGVLGYIGVQTKAKALRITRHSAGEATAVERSLLIVPSFCRKAIELRSHSSLGQISRTLRYSPVIPFKSPESKIFNMSVSGHLEELQDLFTHRRWSPYVRDEVGRTLLHHAAQSSKSATCSMLLRYGVDPDQTDSLGNKALHNVAEFWCPGDGSQDVVDTLRVLTTAQDHVTTADHFLLFFSYRGPPVGAELMVAQDILPDESHGDDHTAFSLLATALSQYGLGRQEWRPFISKLLQKRVDVHVRAPQRKDKFGLAVTTPLDELFRHTCAPFTGDVVAKDWLGLLAEEGYGVVAYLQEEMALHAVQQSSLIPYCWMESNTMISRQLPRKLVFQYGDSPSVGWELWIDPKSQASMVRNESQHFDVDHFAERSQYSEWNMNARATWPFKYAEWSECAQPWKHTNGNEWIAWQQKNILAHDRFARRDKKKRLKHARARGILSTVPRTWDLDRVGSMT